MPNDSDDFNDWGAPPPDDYRGGGGQTAQRRASAPPVAPRGLDDDMEVEPIRWSPEIDKIAGALAAAQAEMANAETDRENTHLRSRYATLAAIWQACRVPLGKNGIAVVQGPAFAGGGVTVATRFVHSSGQWFECSIAIRTDAAKGLGSIQVIGSAITYLRRYLLGAMAGVATAEGDDDGESMKDVAVRPGRDRAADRGGSGVDAFGNTVRAFSARFRLEVDEVTVDALVATFERALAGAKSPDAVKALGAATSMFGAQARADDRCAEAERRMTSAVVARTKAANGGGVAGRAAQARAALDPPMPTPRTCSHDVRGTPCGRPIADNRPVDLCDEHA